MANVKATMTDIRVIIRELSPGTSLREMERKLQLSRTSLRNYRDRAEAIGRSMANLLSLNDAELQESCKKAMAIVAGTQTGMPLCKRMLKATQRT